MNISQEKIDDLNAVITVELTPEDYKKTVEDAIKSQAKKAKLPGFRPGMVPASHIKRMYGKAILVDEVNRLVSEKINSYISENDVNILGQPLPKEDDEAKQYNWDFNDTFNFQYDIGLAPEFDVPFNEKTKFTEYQIKADEETMQSRLSNLRKSYGKRTNPEVSEANDMVFGDLKQLDDKGQELEGGIEHAGSLRIDLAEDEKTKKSLIGLKKGDEVTLDLKKAYKPAALANILNISEEEAEALNSPFRLIVKNINRLEEADLNQEFYDKVFGEGVVKTEGEFHEKVREEVEKMLQQNATQKLQNDMYEKGMEAVNVDFPDAFLKRWLKATNEKLSEEELEEGYQDFIKNLKWTLIENKVLTDGKLEIKYEDVFQSAKEKLAAQLQMYGQQQLSEEQLAQYTAQLLQDKEQASRIFEEVKAQKVFEHLKGLVQIGKKEIDYNKFLELK